MDILNMNRSQAVINEKNNATTYLKLEYFENLVDSFLALY